MISFENGKKYPLSVRLGAPGKRHIPFTTATIGYENRREQVIGKVDTGAFRTLLNEETAEILGIKLPSENSPDAKTAFTATGKALKYFVYQIYFCFCNERGDPLIFPIKAGFSPSIVNNLFGVDWLDHVCLGIDKEVVHLLRD